MISEVKNAAQTAGNNTGNNTGNSTDNKIGNAWVFGDNISTDALAPGAYMKAPMEELARHCLDSVDPRFAAEIQAGDIVVGGENFGMGSSREQAVMALNQLGVSCVIATSFAGLFFRNCINLGLPALVCAEAGGIRASDKLTVDATSGRIRNLSQGVEYACEPIPPHLMAMLVDGGLLPHLAKRLRVA